MAFADRYDSAIGIFVQRAMRNVHTNIRGKVTEVDYGGGTVTVQPTAFTQYPSGTIDSYPAINDLPIQLPSGNGGKAILSMPIKAGDTMGIAFSERNEDDNTDEGTHEMSPGWAATHVLGQVLDPDNVILKNDKSAITLKPAGDITLVNPVVNIEALPDGNVKINNGAGNVVLAPSGQLNVNGATITPDGRIKTANGIDLDDFYQLYLTHFHRGVETGNGQTQTPSN